MKRFSSLFPGLGWRHRDLDSNTFQVTLISWDAWEILLSHGCLVAWRTLASRPSLSSTSSTFSPPLLRWAGPCLPKKPTSAFLGFPCDSACKESACNAGDLWETWVGKIPWRRETLPTPVFWPGELHVLYSPWVHKESDTTEDFHFTSLQSWRKRHPVLKVPPAFHRPLVRLQLSSRSSSTSAVSWALLCLWKFSYPNIPLL